MASSNSTIVKSGTTRNDLSEIRTRGTFILITTIIDDSKKADARMIEINVDNMKKSIIELIKLVAEKAHSSDIVEVYVYDQELAIRSLITSCAAAKVATEENFNRVRNIEFHTSTCTDIFVFVNDLNTHSIRPSVQESIIHRLGEMRNVSLKWVLSSGPLPSEKESGRFLGLYPVVCLSTATGSDDIRRRIILVYEMEPLPPHMEKLVRAPSTTDSERDVTPVPTGATIRYEERNNITSEVSEEQLERTIERQTNIQHQSDRTTTASTNDRNDQRADTLKGSLRLFPFSPSFK